MNETLYFDWRLLALFKLRRTLAFGIAEVARISPMPVTNMQIALDAPSISKLADLKVAWWGSPTVSDAPLAIITDPARGALVLGRRHGKLPETLILRPGEPTIAFYDDELVVRLIAAWEAFNDTCQEAAAPATVQP